VEQPAAALFSNVANVRICSDVGIPSAGPKGDRTLPGESDYRFGAFELLARRQLLLHAGAPVRIGSRALALLTVLVAGAGDLVTKEELIAAAWPTTFVDESNLKVNVSNLRRALGIVGGGQDYIATVPGRGYRFVAAVHRIPVGAGGLPPGVPLIGRANDLAAVQESLVKHAVVTVVGTGGIGKTALAIGAAYAAAPLYSDGVMFVDLAKISAPLFIPAALAFALGLTTTGEDPLAGVIHALEGQRKLLLIDNCEHLLPAVAGVIDRLSTSLDSVRILATSREPLRIRDEHVHRLDALSSDPCPNPTASEAWADPAVELFVTRACEHTAYEWCDADAPNVAEICRRLDGIPLAIELAATRIGAWTPTQLLEMLDDRFKVLAHGDRKAPLRQQTLHATLDWGYSLLSDGEAAFVRALSVFAGKFCAEGAIAVAPSDTPPETAIDVLSSLAAKSFLVLEWRKSAVGYRLLETMRAYLLARLRLAGEEREAKRRHAEFICALLERMGNGSATDAIQGWGAKFAHCLDDVRSALAWTLSSDEDAALAVRLAVVALPLWSELSLHDECRETSERALARLEAMPIPDQRLRAHLLLGVAMGSICVPEDADAKRRRWETALRAAHAIDDADLLAQVLSGLARCEMLAGRHIDALRHAHELRSVAKRLNSSWARDEGDLLLARAEIYQARLPQALTRLEQLVDRQAQSQLAFRRGMQQIDPRLQLGATFAATLWLTGAPARAALVADATVREAREAANRQSLCQILSMGTTAVALWNGHTSRASRYAAELARLVAQYELTIWKPVSLCLEVLVACAVGKEVQREDLLAACDAMLALPPQLVRPIYLVMIADQLVARGHLIEAKLPIGASRAKLEASQGERWPIPELLRVEGILASRSGDARTAERLLLQSLASADEAGATGWSLRTALSLAYLRRDAGRECEAAAILRSAMARVVDGAGTKDYDEARELSAQLGPSHRGFEGLGDRLTTASVAAGRIPEEIPAI
jgi:predicted ATPase/DNA-binding winged helix-turn-helix (wHTH) protein